AGAVLFPLSVLAFAPGSRRRGRTVFLLFSLAGFAYGASAPGLLDLTSHLPGFDLALNYRLVFLAGFGLSGLAALGAESLAAGAVAPARLTLATPPLGREPARFVAAGDGFRPNASALYGIEDARGYESLVLDRFADTFPLWSTPRAASFNSVDDLSRPFLGFL